MGSLILAVLLLFALGGGLLLLLDQGEMDSGLTLVEIDAWLLDGGEGAGFSLVRRNENGSVAIMGQQPEAIFYGVLGVCALLLALRVLISLAQSARERRRWSSETKQPEFETPPADPVIVSASVHRALESSLLSPPNQRSSLRWRDQVPRSIHGPFARILFTFAGIIAGIGVLTAGLVYLRLHDSLTEQALLRARVIAVNISDGAAPFLFKKAATPMRELLRKQSGKPEMAYILVEDRSRRIFAHSLSVLPGEVASSAAQGAADAARHRLLRVGGSDVYEVAAPILEGRAGTVRVGIWRDKVEEEIRAIIFPVMTWLISLTIGGLGIAAFLAWRIYRPILKLASTAKAISSGALDTPTPHVQDSGELGELSRAIERMRSSVKAAMIRLSR